MLDRVVITTKSNKKSNFIQKKKKKIEKVNEIIWRTGHISKELCRFAIYMHPPPLLFFLIKSIFNLWITNQFNGNMWACKSLYLYLYIFLLKHYILANESNCYLIKITIVENVLNSWNNCYFNSMENLTFEWNGKNLEKIWKFSIIWNKFKMFIKFQSISRINCCPINHREMVNLLCDLKILAIS